MYSDVIAAISTPLGKGGVALVRVSGRGAVAIVEKIFFPRSKKALSDYPARFAVYGELRDSRSLIDTCLVTRFEAPASFTGEELVEISCHGGWIVTTMVLETVLGAGARMAEAGEFTRRAFVNDKVTLTEAEAIGDLLSAVSREGVRMSSSQATGALSERMKGITDSLVALISSLYAYIDYPDEDLEDVDDETLSGALSSITSDCERLASTFRAGNAIAHGVPTVIVGKPNVGKSSLFNMLVGEARAIVTDIPGTTRDVLETVVDVEGVALRLFDTAGMRSVTSDVIEEIGINSARERALSPDTSLILALFDTSRPFEADDEALVALLSGQRDKTVIPVFSKTDLPSLLDRTRVEELLGGGVEISSVSDTGADALKREIFKSYVGDTLPSPNEAHLTGLRQHTSLVRGIETLRSAALELSSGMKDMVGMTLERALSELLEVDARSASEMIVNEIFSKFCVGK